MDQRILLVEDVTELLRVSRCTIDRWVREAREGKSDFPIPFSQPGRRMLWDAHVMEQWLENRNKAALPIAPAKSEKQKAREFAARLERARATLRQHGLNDDHMVHAGDQQCMRGHRPPTESGGHQKNVPPIRHK